ncbi:armadillo-type protein [Boletus edulis]|nr:armadillo-type protein [Boletus edulis]
MPFDDDNDDGLAPSSWHLSLSQVLDVFKLLTETYPRYIDTPSRDAVEHIGMRLVQKDESIRDASKLGVLDNVLGWLANEATRISKPTPSSYAAADLFVLLNWSCGLYTTCTSANPDVVSSDAWRVLTGILATLLDLLLNPSIRSKPTMQKSALVRTRRALRSAPQHLHLLMSTLVSHAKSSQTPLIYIPLLSTAVDVTIRLKNVKDDSLTQIPPSVKEGIINLYTTHILMSKFAVPLHTSSALYDFIRTSISPDDLSTSILPTMEKALLRSPEYSLSVIADFLLAYSHPLDIPTLKKLLIAALNSAKSTNPNVRTSASALFKVLVSKFPPEFFETAVSEILTLPLAGKTTGVDHRITLYTMLTMLPKHDAASTTLVHALPTLMVKETNDVATSLLARTLPTHLSHLLACNTPISADVTSLIAKEMNSAKPAVKRAFVSVLGTALWALDTLDDATKTFAKAVSGALEGCLKTVSANPLGAAALEGYVALAILLKIGSDDVASRSVNIDMLTGSPTKPSFLIWDKVYQKLTEAEDATWLLRASDLAMQSDLLKHHHQRVSLGAVFVHLAVHTPFPDVRRATTGVLAEAVAKRPQLLNAVLRDAITASLSKPVASAKATAPPASSSEEQEKPAVDKRGRYAAVLLACASVGEGGLDVQARRVLIVDWLVLAHHPAICAPSRTLWIELCQRASTDPFEVLNASMMDSKLGFAEASYRAIGTLAFVAPQVVLPRLMDQLRVDINAKALGALTEEDLGIWETPEGTTYVDCCVRASRAKSTKAGQGAGAGGLSKEAQALVQAQLVKEAAVRERSGAASASVKAYVRPIAECLLEGAVSQGPFETFVCLTRCCSERLEGLRRWVGVAVLRALEVGCVPEAQAAEALHSLVLRVLYRLRTLSERAPFDAADCVARKGGVGVDKGSEHDADEALEQVTLVLDVIKFHRSEFSDPAFPRKTALEHVVHVVRTQPRLTKERAIQANATRDEVGVLIEGTLLQETHVRNACLLALQPFDLTELDWSPELWIACHDADEQNARLAGRVWEDNGLDVAEGYLGDMLDFLGHENAYVRASAAAAIADAVEHHPLTGHKTIDALRALYRDKAKILAPEFDEYGMLIAQSVDRTDPWPTRVAIALAFAQLAPSFPETQVEPFFRFLIQDEALGDRSADVRRDMLHAGAAVIDYHGASQLAGLLSTFETHLAGPSPATETGDQIKEAVVILFGRAARHLAASDARIPGIVDRLVDALQTPAEQVQMAVSDCLVPLVTLMGEDRSGQLIDGLFKTLFDAPKYAARRGAAYGLAGVIKGLGIGAMKRFDVSERLRVAAEDKKRSELRQGAMFTFETLSSTLGRLFEPYITFILPILLTGMLRRVIMGNMSGYGVKLILPSLLSGLDEKQWRSKKGSIELLGMMAYCSPRQLSLSLPIVIPRLTGVLTDTHAQVKTSANKSLKAALVPTLLKALVDPVKTTVALSALLKTSFMHYIDHSSLALVIPIIERGLRDRGAEGKKKAAQIVGNLASLTDSKDFVPYLSSLLPMVHLVLVDPVPEARATAAKTLGTLVERLGEVHFPDLVPGLLRTLKTETSGVDRQGAAQGLSEVLSGLGMDRLEGLLPDIIANAQSSRSTVREGFMSLLVYLPATFGNRFQPHLPKIIAPYLERVPIELLLPALEEGMFDSRMAHSGRVNPSITLVGELLFKVSGITSKLDMGDEEEVAEVAVAESVLGAERRDRILSALYLARQDAVSVVRQSSIHIWKALVHNTPRTVREILPELVCQLVKLCSSDEFEQQETATRTTTELCRKFGEKILGVILPILQHTLASPDARTRQGVCLMLSDIMESTTDAQREGHESEIVNMVRASLVDDDATVRTAAARAFDTLQEHIGAKAIDQTIPTLLEALRQPGESSGTALQALQEVMSVRAATVFPVLVPTLIASPMTVFNARALASLVTVAGNALSKRLIVILNALIKVLEEDEDEELLAALDEALRALLRSIEDPEGLNTLMLLLLGWTKSDAPTRRASACDLFAIFCEESSLDSSLYRVDWVRQLVSLFDDPEVGVHTAAWKAFDTLVKSVPKDELEPLVVPLRRTIEGTGAPGRSVPGFSLSKGVAPTVPIIIAGLTTGSNEQRENAAYAIGDLVERTEESAIKPFVVPLLTAILSALTAMLARIPNHVKPFFPQLQRTFVKSVSDPSSIVVRTRAADALGVLMRSQPRVDPVVTELVGGARASEEEIAASYVLALAHVVKSSEVHGGVGDKVRETCVELVHEAFRGTQEDHYVQAMASFVASLSATHPRSLKSVVNAYLVSGTPPSALCSHTILAILQPDDTERTQPEETLFGKLDVLRSVALKIKESAANERPMIARPARDAREVLKAMAADGEESLVGIF